MLVAFLFLFQLEAFCCLSKEKYDIWKQTELFIIDVVIRYISFLCSPLIPDSILLQLVSKMKIFNNEMT